ncbi:hypothetical protein B0H13DRAFT_2422497 [Mycena leptocephala]|nr:hypothetical protein B0H13DRAFT_2422497 [Mycena leptocephala]
MPAGRSSSRRAATSASNTVRINASQRSTGGRVVNQRARLNATEILAAKKEQARKAAERLQSMSRTQRRELEQLQEDTADFDDDGGYEDDILHGRAAAQISNAGEDIEHATELLEGLREQRPRTRRKRTQLQANAFAAQLERMSDAYLAWSHAVAEERGLPSEYSLPEDAVVQERRLITVVDIFLPLPPSQRSLRGVCLCASGLDAFGPYSPTVLITICALEIFRVAHLRCPRLGIQVFVRALCDMHGVAPRPWLGTQFSVAFDVYLAIRGIVDKRVQVALGRDTPNWRLKNACPACLYKLEGEPSLEIPLMVTIDRNNSLSRWDKREKGHVEDDGTWVPGASKERENDRALPGDYYLPREEVDRWSKDGVDELMKGFERQEGKEGEEGEESLDEGGGCAERWQNMKEAVTTRAYGMYDETGFFPSLCRHGFVLVVVDMIKSGELSKYGLSITYHLLTVLGQIALGYDIGCRFGKLVKGHPGLSVLAALHHFRALIGAFHGSQHGRRCAVDNLMTYVKGVGLEALEGCESFFSKSNALAATTRYASRFHRQQAITMYLKHTDKFDTYQGLSLALEIKSTYRALLDTMRDFGIESRDVFEEWRKKEKAHLDTLSKEPLEETLEMEYWDKLVKLRAAEDHVTVILGAGAPFLPAQGSSRYEEAVKETRCLETQRRHALENQARALAAAQDLEVRLAVTGRWAPGDEKWGAAAVMVGRRQYQRALDNLQGLIIARMFELAKCNMAGTGYKLRKHIAKALQARSKAVKTAITKYNEAAVAMRPPKPTLTWEEVVEYAFLADFDLLREGREDIRGELWAQPAGRAAMDQHYKLLRADEEIERLNVEIRRLVTYMVDEQEFFNREEERLRAEGEEALAHQVRVLRGEHGRFTGVHMSRLVKLSKEPGFTGSLTPGVSVSRERHIPVMRDRDVNMRPASPPLNGEDLPPVGNNDDDDEEEEDSEDDDGTLTAALLNLMRISGDEAGQAEDT